MELFSHNSDALYILAFMKCLKRFLCRVTAGCESVFEFKEGERKEQTHTDTHSPSVLFIPGTYWI